MKVIFMGTPDFSVPALDRLILAGHEIACVYTRAPKAAGRGKKERKTPVHARAEALGLPVRTPRTLRDAEAQTDFAALDADIAVVVAYGLILPKEILDAPRLGCLNIHASLLPRWRGAAPIHRAVMTGDAETGVAIMQMEAGLDTGPVLLSEATAIGAEETTGDLHDRLALMGAELIVRALRDLDDLTAAPQPDTGVTYAEKIDKAEARVDWTRPAKEVDRLIRGLSPFPGAWCEVAGERVKLLRSRVIDASGTPGQVIGDLQIACGEGAVEVTEVQRQGKRAMTAEEALRGMEMPERLD